MNVKTGAILGMAVSGDFDPNDPYTITDEEVMEAARQAEIHEDILAMPDGYQTYVGERLSLIHI